MAEFDLEKFNSLTEGAGATLETTPLPRSTNAVFDISQFNQMTGDTTAQNLPPTTITATPSMTPAERFGRRTEEGDFIPFDVKRGLGSRLAEWRVAQQSGDAAKLEVLQKLYPNNRTRILPTGDLSVELIDSETGKPKEVLVDPQGIGEMELMELASQMPEIAASTAAAIATRGTGKLKTAAQIVLSALAGGGVGAMRDIKNRTAEGIPTNIGEIAERRSTEATLDMFLDVGLLGVAKSFRALSPFASEVKPGTKEFDVVRGREFFREAFGEDIKLTPAEVTGSKALSALEAAEAPQPGSRTVMSKFREKTNEQVGRIQKIATGETTAEEQIGETSIGIIRKDLVEPLERALETARTTATAKGEKRIIDLIDEATGIGGPGPRLTEAQAGSTVLEDFDIRMGQAKQKVDLDFERVRSLPGGSGDVLDGTPVADAARAIRKELTAVKTSGGKELLTTGVPEGLLRSLDDMEKLRGGKVSLQTLTNMKNSAYDAIAAFRTATGDRKDRWFKKVADGYEQGIEKGVASTGDPRLKEALSAAKETYKKELLPFERPGLKELAKDEFTGGRIAPEQIVGKFFEGPKAVENYRMLKEVLGSDSPAFRVMKRAWADTKLAAAGDKITGSIQPGELRNAIDGLAPELREELFGKNADAIVDALKLQTGIKNLKTLDEDAVRTLLSIKDPTRKDFESLLLMQRHVNQSYVNSLVGDVADGLPIASKIKPTEFVKRLLNTNTPTKDVEKVIGAIAKESPETRRAIANHTMYQLLDAASIREADTAGKLISGEPLNLSPMKLADALGRPGTAQRNRYELLLGRDTLAISPPKRVVDNLGRESFADTNPTRLEVLENIVRTLGPREGRERAFAASGTLASGQTIQNLFRDPLKYATSYAKKAALTALYLGPMSKLTANRVFTGPELAAVANTMIASEPFVRRITEIAGDEAMAMDVISELKGSIDRFIDEWKESPSGRESERTARFLGGEQVPMTIQGR